MALVKITLVLMAVQAAAALAAASLIKLQADLEQAGKAQMVGLVLHHQADMGLAVAVDSLSKVGTVLEAQAVTAVMEPMLTQHGRLLHRPERPGITLEAEVDQLDLARKALEALEAEHLGLVTARPHQMQLLALVAAAAVQPKMVPEETVGLVL